MRLLSLALVTAEKHMKLRLEESQSVCSLDFWLKINYLNPLKGKIGVLLLLLLEIP